MGPGQKKQLVVAITGASGSGFAVALLKRLSTSARVEKISLILSSQGENCLSKECGLSPSDLEIPRVRLENQRRLDSPLCSGSHLQQGMVILPCSMGTLGRIASGVSDSLITRTADVCLKERRLLILCLRESPLNRIHLENMLKAHDAGAIIMPLMPTFYHQPQGIPDLFEAFATRILDQLGLEEEDTRRWGAENNVIS